MKVFISWSGASSRAVAEALADWFPKVIQGVEPFVSAKDIDKGANWTVELARELNDAEFGVVCLAPDNLLSPWLNYEAGAITKSVDSRVCPVLLGVGKSDVRPPISQLQMTAISQDDFELLMASMNKAAGNPLAPLALHEAVETWWPKLQSAIDAISIPPAPVTLDGVQEPAQPETTTQEMLTELLHRVRQMDIRLGRVERGGRTRSATGNVHETSSTKTRHEIILDTLLAALLSSSINPQSIGFARDGVQAHVSSPLPDPLPGGAYATIGEIAKEHGVEVQLVGPDRTVTFDRSGFPDEPPF